MHKFHGKVPKLSSRTVSQTSSRSKSLYRSYQVEHLYIQRNSLIESSGFKLFNAMIILEFVLYYEWTCVLLIKYYIYSFSYFLCGSVKSFLLIIEFFRMFSVAKKMILSILFGISSSCLILPASHEIAVDFMGFLWILTSLNFTDYVKISI